MILENLSLAGADFKRKKRLVEGWQRLDGLFFCHLCRRAVEFPYVRGFHGSLKPSKPLIPFIFRSGG